MQQALDKLIEEVDSLIDELNKNPLIEKIKQKKKFINEFSKNFGGDIIYSDVTEEGISIIPGQFKGWTLAKAVKWFLDKRGKDNPPTFEDIREALKQGDYDGRVSDIRIAIMKNNQITLLKGSGVQRFGLMEWYGTKKKRSTRGAEGEEDEDNAEETDENPELNLKENKNNTGEKINE